MPSCRKWAFRPFRRGDNIRQAFSLWKALQTQERRRDSDVEIGGRDLRFSFAAVDHLKLRIDEHNHVWRSFYVGCASEPARVVYEDLVVDYRGTVERVVREVGIPLPDDFAPVEPKMKRQADELSEEWVRLYDEGKTARTVVHAGRV